MENYFDEDECFTSFIEEGDEEDFTTLTDGEIERILKIEDLWVRQYRFSFEFNPKDIIKEDKIHLEAYSVYEFEKGKFSIKLLAGTYFVEGQEVYVSKLDAPVFLPVNKESKIYRAVRLEYSIMCNPQLNANIKAGRTFDAMLEGAINSIKGGKAFIKSRWECYNFSKEIKIRVPFNIEKSIPMYRKEINK